MTTTELIQILTDLENNNSNLKSSKLLKIKTSIQDTDEAGQKEITNITLKDNNGFLCKIEVVRNIKFPF